MKEEIKEMIDKIKKCLISGYDLDIITQEEMGILWNYITNLQEENENLKDYLKIMEKGKDNNLNRFLDYKSRNEKAIEFIEEHTMKNTTFKSLYLDQEEKEILLNILKGDKDE